MYGAVASNANTVEKYTGHCKVGVLLLLLLLLLNHTLCAVVFYRKLATAV